MYAIRNKKTKKWIYATDFRRGHFNTKSQHMEHTQFQSEDCALTYQSAEYARLDMLSRGISDKFEVVQADLVEVAHEN